jgi:hypothetical protein
MFSNTHGFVADLIKLLLFLNFSLLLASYITQQVLPTVVSLSYLMPCLVLNFSFLTYLTNIHYFYYHAQLSRNQMLHSDSQNLNKICFFCSVLECSYFVVEFIYNLIIWYFEFAVLISGSGKREINNSGEKLYGLENCKEILF